MDRRAFLQSSLAAALVPSALAAAAGNTAAGGKPGPAAKAPASGRAKRTMKKGFMLETLRSDTSKALTVRQKFQLLRDCGFDGVEVMGGMKQDEVLAARDAVGIAIPSLVIELHWKKPITDPNPAVRAEGLESLRQGLRDAKAYGADSVLFVPGTVTKTVSYADAYARARDEIAKAVPLAESLGVAIALENVWNRFLLSPMEAAAFIDSFKSPAVRWHFDVGNIANYGWPEHWIETLGKRIAKVHAKEYSRKIRDTKGPSAGFKVDLLEGDCDWPVVMAALDRIGYGTWLIAEQYRPDGLTDAAWLTDLAKRLDRIIAS